MSFPTYALFVQARFGDEASATELDAAACEVRGRDLVDWLLTQVGGGAGAVAAVAPAAAPAAGVDLFAGMDVFAAPAAAPVLAMGGITNTGGTRAGALRRVAALLRDGVLGASRCDLEHVWYAVPSWAVLTTQLRAQWSFKTCGRVSGR